METSQIEIFKVPIDCVTLEETVAIIDDAICNDLQILHTVVNAGKIVLMQNNKQLYDSIVSADIINADGQAVIWASRILNKPLPERVTGIDLMQRLVSLAHAKDYKIYLLGAKEEVVSKMVRTYSNTYSATLVAGSRNGYFKEDEEEEIAMEINMSRANMLFVAMSSPKKEIFLDKYRDLLKNVNLIMGVGGSFDVITGKTKRAPLWMQSSGLEWLYRFLQEPGRMWKRYLIGNTKFVLLVLSELIRRKPFK